MIDFLTLAARERAKKGKGKGMSTQIEFGEHAGGKKKGGERYPARRLLLGKKEGEPLGSPFAPFSSSS